jgi:hypothetical protein
MHVKIKAAEINAIPIIKKINGGLKSEVNPNDNRVPSHFERNQRSLLR